MAAPPTAAGDGAGQIPATSPESGQVPAPLASAGSTPPAPPPASSPMRPGNFMRKASSKFNQTRELELFAAKARATVQKTGEKPEEPDLMVLVQHLLTSRAYGLPGTDGTYWSNFWAWTKNKHPFIACFTANDAHPYTRWERRIVLLELYIFAFAISALFEVPRQSACSGSCDDDVNQDDDRTCEERCEDAEDNWWVVALIVGALSLVYEEVLKCLAICSLVQKRCVPDCIRKCVEGLGSLGLCLFGCSSLFWIIMGVLVTLQAPRPLLVLWSFAVGKLQSYFMWFVLFYPRFACSYKRHKREFESEWPGLVNLDCVSFTKSDLMSVAQSAQAVTQSSVSQAVAMVNSALAPQSPATSTPMHDSQTPDASPQSPPAAAGGGGGGTPQQIVQQQPQYVQQQPQNVQQQLRYVQQQPQYVQQQPQYVQQPLQYVQQQPQQYVLQQPPYPPPQQPQYIQQPPYPPQQQQQQQQQQQN